MKSTVSTLQTIHIVLCICIAGAMLLPAATIAAGPDADEYEYEYPDARTAWEAAHNASGSLPPLYKELRALPEEELRQRIDAMRVTPETREWPVHESPAITFVPDMRADSSIDALPHPAEWWVSAINPVNNESGNYSEIGMIPEIGRGDTIHVWGIPGHTYEGGFTISAADVTVRQWEGSPVQPVLKSPVNITPAITISGDNATLSGLNISGTSVTEGNGAGVSAMGTDETPLERLTVIGCTFSGNRADGEFGVAGYGGGLFAAHVSDIRITGCTFSDNYAGTSGGGAYILESGVDMRDCIFSENSADLHGGGAYFEATDSVIAHTTFTANDIHYGDGGGVMFCNGEANLINTTISKNTGAFFGGGACFQDMDVDITDSGIRANRMSDRYGSSFSEGAGAYFSSCNVSITDTMISGNDILPGFCGGVSFQGCDVTLVNTSIEHNGAGFLSGGVSFSGSTVRMINTTIFGNIVDFYGAGMMIGSSDITMKNSAVDRNCGEYGSGGYIHGSNITLIDSSVSDNFAWQWGGGAWIIESNMIVENSSVSNNEVYYEGGGVYCTDSTAIFEDTLFSGNSALVTGGGISCKDSDVSFAGVTFLNNSAVRGGSAILAVNCNGIQMNDTFVKGPDAEIACAKTAINAENVTFDAFLGNTNTISCTGWNLGLATAPVPSPGPDGNKTIRHALSVTGISTTDYTGPSEYDARCDLRMKYRDADLGTVNESLLMLFFANGTSWDEIPNATTDTAEKYISVVLTEKDLPESVVEDDYMPINHWNWTSLVPAGPTSTEETISLSLVPGWNMVSSPFKTVTAVTVPDEVVGMYGYDTENETYVIADPTAPLFCNGYWIGANEPCTMNVTGVPLTCYQQNLSAGWNMIGCRMVPIPIANLSTTPNTPVSFYRYNPATEQYEVITITEALLPGEGYWAGVPCCCVLEED